MRVTPVLPTHLESLVFFKIFSSAPRDLRNPSSPTRDQTPAPSTGSSRVLTTGPPGNSWKSSLSNNNVEDVISANLLYPLEPS